MPADPIAAAARAVVSSPLLNFMPNDKTLLPELQCCIARPLVTQPVSDDAEVGQQCRTAFARC